MIMKNKTAKNIHMSMVDYSNAKEFLESIEKQIKSFKKALTSKLIGTLTTKKYDGMASIHEHILEMSNFAKQPKIMDMTIFKPLVGAIYSQFSSSSIWSI